MKGQLAAYITYTTTPTNDIALEATDKHKAITAEQLQGLACLAPITTVGYPAIIARQYAALEGETPEDYIAKLILRDQWQRRDMAEVTE